MLPEVGYCSFAVLLLDSTAHEGLLVGKRLLQAVSNAVELEDYLPLILEVWRKCFKSRCRQDDGCPFRRGYGRSSICGR